MGLICSCFCAEDFRNPNGSQHRPCGCLSFLSRRFMRMYTLLLQREEHAAPSTSSSLVSVAPITDESYASTFRSLPRPLPFDDPIFTRKRHDGPARRHEKPLSHPYEESDSLSRIDNEGKIESACLAAKLCGYNCEVSTKFCSESSQKHSSAEIMSGAIYMFPSSEEEDVCPTCLEEYTSDDPRIILQCSHNFHLGCTYEWMERSELCPICGKVMIFNETS